MRSFFCRCYVEGTRIFYHQLSMPYIPFFPNHKIHHLRGDIIPIMLVFSSDVINEALRSTTRPGYNPNLANGPSHHGGEIGGSLEELILSLLNISSCDTFGDVGCGRGKLLIRTQLTYQSNLCFGIEIDSPRVHHMIFWWIDVYLKLFSLVPNLSRTRGARRNPSWPQIIHDDFTSDQFWIRRGQALFSRRKLKLFFNNFGGHMLYDGVQNSLEERLNLYCQPGTLVVSLCEMFLGSDSRKVWRLVSLVNHVIVPGDVSWCDGGDGREIKVFVYVKS